MKLLIGIFVGGRSRRMEGRAKGLLQAPHSQQTLLDRLLTEALAALPAAECVLVGRQVEYAGHPLPVIEDARADSGPLAGLVALLLAGQERGCTDVIALACDMPYLSRASIGLIAAHAKNANAVAPKRAVTRSVDGVQHEDMIWEPLVARYATGPCLRVAQQRLSRGQLSLQGLLTELGADCHGIELPEQELSDWDTPEDVRAGDPTREAQGG